MIKKFLCFRKILSIKSLPYLFLAISQNLNATSNPSEKINSSTFKAMVQILSSANELDEYETLCKNLDKGKLDAAAEDIGEFKNNYLFAAYENRFSAIRAYLEYKDVDIEQNEEDESSRKNLSEDAFSPLNASPEISAYCLYLSGLKQEESTDLSLFQRKLIKLTPAYLHPEISLQSLKTFKDFLYTYPKHPFAYDAQQREKLLYQRLADMRLLQMCVLFEKKAYVGVINFGLTVIKEYPQSNAAIQSLLLLAMAYEHLNFEDLSQEMLKVYYLNRNKIKSLVGAKSVTPWHAITKNFSQAQSNALEDEALPIQEQLEQLEQRTDFLEKKAIDLVQRQKHTIESALESHKKLGIVQELTQLKALMNQWLEFQLKDNYIQMSVENMTEIKSIFSPFFEVFAKCLETFESHLKIEEERFNAQKNLLSQSSVKTLLLSFFDDETENKINKQLNVIAKIRANLEKDLKTFENNYSS